MSDRMELQDLDLQLYLAGALPFSHKVKLTLALILNSQLRAQLRQVQNLNQVFRDKEMPSLEAKLFKPGYRQVKLAPSFEKFWPRWSFAGIGSMALLALCALPLTTHFGPISTWDEPAYIAKGHGLGVNLFVKGDTAYRIEHQSAKILPSDTLQVIPLGSGTQHMVLLGWDAVQGMVVLFPKEKNSQQVSAANPPPALLLQGMEENRLICITSSKPFSVDQILETFARHPFVPTAQAPISRLVSGRYIQIFTLVKKTRRI